MRVPTRVALIHAVVGTLAFVRTRPLLVHPAPVIVGPSPGLVPQQLVNPP